MLLLFLLVAAYISIVGIYSATGFILLIILLFGLIASLLFFQLGHRVHWALLLVIISVTVNGTRFGLPVTPDGLLVPFLTVVLLLSVPARFARVRSYPLFLPVCGFVLVNFAASFLISPVRSLSVHQSLIFVSRALTFFVVVIAVQSNPALRSRLPQYLLLLLLIHTIISLVALSVVHFILTPFIVYGQDGSSSVSINGFFLEPNLFAIFVLCVIALFLPIALFSRTKHRIKISISIIIGLIGLVLSYTRSSWIGFIVVVSCLVLCTFGRPGKKIRNSVVMLVAFLALLVSLFLSGLFVLDSLGIQSNLAHRFTAILDQNSDSARQRTGTWRAALGEWQSHKWLGTGPLSFVAAAPSSKGWLFSSVVQTLHDSGLIGTFCMLWLCGGAIRYAWRAYYAARNDQDKAIALGYVLAQVALFFTSQFSSFFWGGFAWLLLGLAVGHSTIILNQRTNLATA
ncbi:MAG: O-antigen ligase family protein [Herpetosiphonaceae bacterium]|nr:O-antigen ligase family protein [Herpetosiphonaceae bacterium]